MSKLISVDRVKEIIQTKVGQECKNCQDDHCYANGCRGCGLGMWDDILKALATEPEHECQRCKELDKLIYTMIFKNN